MHGLLLFGDGNKRTAFAVMIIFLEWNQFSLKDEICVVIRSEKQIPSSTLLTTAQILEDFIQETAQGQLDYDDVLCFLEQNTTAL